MTYPIERAPLAIAFAVLSAALLLSFGSGLAVAGEDLFTEDFTNSSANWANYNSSNILTHVPSGGPDGGAYASGPASFEGLTPEDFPPVMFRARHDNLWNSSGDAFVGNWIATGVREVRAFVRHDVPDTSLTFFLRVAGPFGFPGHTYTTGVPVQPGTWAEQVFDVSKNSTQLNSPEGREWSEVFSDVGHLQFGVLLPPGFESDPTFYTFGIDKVTIATPEPSAAILAIGGLIGMATRYRRDRARSHSANS